MGKSQISGDSQMASLIRRHDWAATPLGALAGWPETLTSTVNLVLSAAFPMQLLWGPEMILFYNDAFLPQLADKHPAALGERAKTVWSEAWPLVEFQLSQVLAHGEITRLESVLIPAWRHGVLVDVYWDYSYSPIYGPSGKVEGILNISQDVTAKVVAEQRLRASEARALRILQSIGDAVIVTDAEAHVTRMNPVAEALTGWPEAEAKSLPLSDIFRIVNETTRLTVESPAAKVKRLGSVVGLANHTVLIRRDGTELHIDDSGAPIRDENGAMQGIVLVFRDVSEKWEQERKLRTIQQNQAFLLALSDKLRLISNPREIMNEAAEAVGRYLQVTRTGYGELSKDGTEITFESGWAEHKDQLLNGVYPFSAFGSGNIAQLRAGITTVYDEFESDPRMADRSVTGVPINAAVGVPIHRRGDLQAVFYVHQETVRRWTGQDINLLKEVAERTTDAVERARNSSSLQMSEEELRYTIELSPQIPWTAGPEGKLLDFSAGWLKLTGLTREQALGEAGHEVTHPEDRLAMTRAWERSVATGEPYDLECRVLTASGEYCWHRSRAFARRGTDGKVVKWYGMTEDIHARRQAEEGVKVERERLLSILQQAPAIFALLTGPEHIITMTNPGYMQLINHRDVLGKRVCEALPDAAAQGYVGILDEVYRGTPYVGNGARYDVSTGNGDFVERYIDFVYQPLREADGAISGIILFGVDVTDRKRSQDALIQSEKLAAVGRLASSIAHEINNPLESVTNLLYIVRSLEHAPETQEYLDAADRELRRVAAITNQTLRFHKQSTAPAEVTSGQLLGDVLALYQGKIANSRVSVQKRLASRHSICCFEGEIRQVISNLVSNAIDAMHPDGGRLLVRSRDAHDPLSNRRGVVLTIADTGSGMSRETLAHAFQPFFTTKGFSGTGLGLWISSEIVGRHQGRLTARSSQTVGRSGTVFNLFLPLEAVSR